MSRRRSLRVGIAGYGVVGKRRRLFVDTHPNLKTVAVCDQKFTGTGRLPDGTRHYRHYRQLLQRDLDILFVCLPNYLAADATIAGLERGLHVFCEKPPGRTVSDILAVRAAEKKHPKLKLKYGFNHRYHYSVRDALKICRRRELGELVNMRGVYGKSKIIPFSGGWRAHRKYAGGGILLDQGIHMIDIMRLFAGDFIAAKSYVSNSYWHHDVEDNAYALLRDRKGRVAMLHSTATQWAHRFDLEVAFQEGYFRLQGILSGSKSYGQERLIIGRRDESDSGASREETITYLQDDSWRDEIYEFAGAVINNKRIQSGSSADALAVMRTVYRIYNSDEEWRTAHRIEHVK
ncbi:MAG: Gfo/Idh/MocA family oxidoreductase [Elusimicrobiota bacterium]